MDQEHDYKLYSVVVHRGGAGRGHYFAYSLDVYGEVSCKGPVVSAENYYKLNSELCILIHAAVNESPKGVISLLGLHKKLKFFWKDLPLVCVVFNGSFFFVP